MWLFSKIGFFSAVLAESDDENEWVMVRGRVREDLERLVECTSVLFQDEESNPYRPEILEWPGRDYPYRVIVEKEVWAEVVQMLAMDIDYTNFKNSIKKGSPTGAKRATLYMDVWRAMLSAERKMGIKPSNESAYGQWQDYLDRPYGRGRSRK